MKKKVILILICIVFLLALAGCHSKFSEDQFLGKTSAEIENEYGPFDCVLMPASEEGLYRDCTCGYTIKEPKTLFFGTSPETLFFIRFDENGIAYSCDEGNRPGG